MLARKLPVLVMVALANKMTRVAWALLSKGGVYKLRPSPYSGVGREVVSGVVVTKDR